MFLFNKEEAGKDRKFNKNLELGRKINFTPQVVHGIQGIHCLREAAEHLTFLAKASCHYAIQAICFGP